MRAALPIGDHVDVVATGTAGAFDAALSVQQKQYRVPEQPGRDGTVPIPAQTVHGTARSPLLPARTPAGPPRAPAGLLRAPPVLSRAPARLARGGRARI